MPTPAKTSTKKSKSAKKNSLRKKVKIGTSGKVESKVLNPNPTFDPQILSLFGLALVLMFIGLVRYQFLDIGMERDEGIYSYFGQLILEGKVPYLDFYEIRLPGIFYMYAIIVGIFGFTIEGVAVGIMLLNMGTAVMLYLIGKQLFNWSTGLIAAAAFALFSLAPEISGFTRQSEHIVIFWSTASLLMMIKALESDKALHFILSGVLISLSFITKGNAVFFILMNGFILVSWYALQKSFDWKKMIFGLFGLMCLGMAAQGAWEEMWFWSFDASSQYVGKGSWESGKFVLNDIIGKIQANSLVLWITAIAGLLLVLVSKTTWQQKIFALLLVGFSAMTITPGLRFYGHYWIMLVPGLALLSGMAFYSLSQLISKSNASLASWMPVGFLLVVIIQVSQMSDYYFAPDHHKVLRDTYGMNPFPESQIIGEFIKNRVQPGEQVALIGSEPQVFIYSNTRSASKHAYFSYLMKDPTTSDASLWSKEFIQEVETSKPKYIVLYDHKISILRKSNSDMSVFTWFNSWVVNNYNRVGLVDMLPNQPATYLWGAEIGNYQPKSSLKAYVYERK